MSNTEQRITLKLLADKNGKRVIFAEAGKDFVDFLLSLMTLPIGTVIRILSANDMLGSLGILYKSFENLSETYVQPEAKKEAVLRPNLFVLDAAAKLLSLPSNADQTVFSCGNCKQYVTYNPKTMCPYAYCGGVMSSSVPFANQTAEASSAGGGGFVKDVVTYTIMDDLEVKPMFTISSIAMLNKYNVKEMSDLEEMVVSFGMVEGLKLLKTSLESKTVLTDVFLGKEISKDIPI